MLKPIGLSGDDGGALRNNDHMLRHGHRSPDGSRCANTGNTVDQQSLKPESWHDVQSCAVDPGAVRSSIWKRAGPIMQWVANHLFAPNEDGCQTVIHAATDAWEPASQPTDTNQQPPNLRVS